MCLCAPTVKGTRAWFLNWGLSERDYDQHLFEVRALDAKSYSNISGIIVYQKEDGVTPTVSTEAMIIIALIVEGAIAFLYARFRRMSSE
jgi:hypothetical protein